ASGAGLRPRERGARAAHRAQPLPRLCAVRPAARGSHRAAAPRHGSLVPAAAHRAVVTEGVSGRAPSRLVTEIGCEPALRFCRRQPLASRAVLELLTVALADVEVARLRW